MSYLGTKASFAALGASLDMFLSERDEWNRPVKQLDHSPQLNNNTRRAQCDARLSMEYSLDSACLLVG